MKTRAMLIAILAVCFLSVPLTFAKSNIGFNGVGAEIGFVDPEDISSTIAFGAAADLGWLTPHIALGAEVLYWSKSFSETSDYELSYSQIYVNAIARYFFQQKKGSKLAPYAGGGLGLVIGKVKSEYKGDLAYYGNYDDSDTGIGIQLLGGARMQLSPQMDGFGEFRFSTGEGADFWGIFAGVIYKLK